MSDINDFDAELADRENIQYINNNNCVLLETFAISDTGAEVSVCHNEIRKVVREERLSDAKSSLMGATGASENQRRNKLKLVKKKGDIDIMETREVKDLGFSSPESTEYIRSCLAEFDAITDDHFNFCKTKTKPRVLLGLKSAESKVRVL